jgi:hypothetical protein
METSGPVQVCTGIALPFLVLHRMLADSHYNIPESVCISPTD